jgi:hypothetical protein
VQQRDHALLVVATGSTADGLAAVIERMSNDLRMTRKRIEAIEEHFDRESAVADTAASAVGVRRSGDGGEGAVAAQIGTRSCQFSAADSEGGAWRGLNRTQRAAYVPAGCANDIHSLLIGEFPSDCGFVGTPGKNKLLILGDSQTYALQREFAALMAMKKVKLIREGSRCDIGEFLGLPPVAAPDLARYAVKPDSGPVKYGAKHPGCTDCAGCDSVLAAYSRDNFTSVAATLEYISIEFAKDCMVQSADRGPSVVALNITTTQQALAYHYDEVRNTAAVPRPSAVISNTGLHDRVAYDWHTHYEANVEAYMRVVKAVALPGAPIVFVLTSRTAAVLRRVRRRRSWYNTLFGYTPENDAPQLALNAAARRAAAKVGGIHIVDPWALATISMHTDEVHIHGKANAYYKALRDIIRYTVLCPLAVSSVSHLLEKPGRR